MDYQAYQQALSWRTQSQNKNAQAGNGNHWKFAGTVNIGGRLTDVEMHPGNLQTMYLGAASGGVFKSTNGGIAWSPVFDQQNSLSIGDLAIAPSDPNTLYVGTGESNGGGGSLTYDGNGVYKSTDAGATWTQVGLELTRNTGRIAVHPTNPDIVFAATMGDLFGNNPDRGLYRSTNGGTSWLKVLSSSDSTGAIEVVINPINPDTVFACLWERVRRPDRRNYGGPSSGIYRSYNGGTTWTKLSNGLPTGINLGRIGIDIAKSNPATLYATLTDNFGAHVGTFRTNNNGDSWVNVTGNFSPNASSYWYGRIKVDPTDPDIAYQIDFDLWKTIDGGANWTNLTTITGVHVDQHEVYIHPLNNDFLILGNDGGFFTSTDGGFNWLHDETLPVTQFYTCELDENDPSKLYGGTQDNGVNTTPTGNLDDWFSIWGGDGFVVLVDPNNSTLVYAESQYAGLNTGIQGVDPLDRTNWNTPFVFNPQNTNSLFLATDKVYKTIDNGTFWTPVSPDLTNGSGTASYPIVYGTITTLAVAPADSNIIYAGTDDGNIQVTFNGGTTWTLVNSGLPYRWVTRIAVDPLDPLTAYATLSGYRYHDNMSHVYKTVNGGNSWINIGSTLPDVPVNDIIFDATIGKLYIASDVGVFYTDEDTLNWQLLGDSMPVVPVTDLRLHEGTRTLLAATYGRSMYTYDLNYLTSGIPVAQSDNNNTSFTCFPNPFDNVLTMEIFSAQTQQATVYLLDINGKKVSDSYLHKLKKGNNIFSFPVNNKNQLLKSGIYFMVVQINLQKTVKKIVKQ